MGKGWMNFLFSPHVTSMYKSITCNPIQKQKMFCVWNIAILINIPLTLIPVKHLRFDIPIHLRAYLIWWANHQLPYQLNVGDCTSTHNLFITMPPCRWFSPLTYKMLSTDVHRTSSRFQSECHRWLNFKSSQANLYTNKNIWVNYLSSSGISLLETLQTLRNNFTNNVRLSKLSW